MHRRKRRKPHVDPRPTRRPIVELLERRETVADLFGAVASAFALAGAARTISAAPPPPDCAV